MSSGRIDAWVFAEGIERVGELEELGRLGVPLGQGYLLGRPGPDRAGDVPVEMTGVLASPTTRSQRTVASLIERVPAVRDGEPQAAVALIREDPGLAVLVLLDASGRPVGLQHREAILDGGTLRRVLLVVRPTTSIREAAQRAATREPVTRFDPIVCSEPHGSYVGVVGVDRLLAALAEDDA